MTRLNILKASLAKKEQLFEAKIDAHFQTVKQANGQPLNDKRNGAATFAKWDKQNDAIRATKDGIERTKAAIEREQSALNRVASVDIPSCLKSAIDSGKITQWRKFPNRFFVNGVDKGRIIFDGGVLKAAYVNDVPKEQYPLFRDTFNGLKAQLKATATREAA